MKKIEIKCETKKYLTIDQLQEMQGKLKRLDKENERKLRNNIIQNGIVFPLFVWQNKIIDGHQRLAVLRKLQQEGYEIDKVPVVEVYAKTEKEAKEKIILANQYYGKATKQSWAYFLMEEKIDINEIKDILTEVNVKALIKDIENKMEYNVEEYIELLEEHNYVIFYFTNKLDWEQVKNKFNIKSVKYKYRSMPHHGVARIIDGKKLLEVLK